MSSANTASVYPTIYRINFQRFLLIFLLFPTLYSHALNGSYTVGTGGTYTTLTGPTGAFNAINAAGLTGNVTLNIISDISEPGSVVLNQWATAGFTVTISPNLATVRTLTYTPPGTATDMIVLNGTDNLIIDGRSGGSGNYLQFVSTETAESVFRTMGDCQNITIRNCIIVSDNAASGITTGGALRVDEDQTTTGCDNMQILYNRFDDNNGAVSMCDAIQINAPNTAGVVMTGLEITGNEFRNINGRGIYIVSRAGSVNQSLIRWNHFYATSTATGGGTGVSYSFAHIASGSGHTIRGNFIGGTNINSGGGPMTVQLGATTSDFAFIRLSQELPYSTTNNIDSNVMRNMSLYGSLSLPMSASFIQVERGHCNIGLNNGNTIGDNSVDATVAPSIILRERFNSIQNIFNAIYITSGGNIEVTSNRIGGMYFPFVTNNGVIVALIGSTGASSPNINYNIIGGVDMNLVKHSSGAVRIFDSVSDGGIINIQGNSVYGMNANNSFYDTFEIIRVVSGTGTPTITDNVIQNLLMNTLSVLNPIRTTNPNAVIERNIIRNVVIATQTAGTAFNGIQILATTGTTGMIRDNIISNIQATSPGGGITNLIGIYASGPVNLTFDSNFIERMSTLSTNNNTFIRGIHMTTATTNQLRNNVVLLDNLGSTNDINIYAVYDDAVSGTHQLYYNTLDIRGTTSGSRSSACYYRTGNAARTIQNNIFNNRRSGGTGGHYALFHNTTGGALTSNYNVLYTEENAARMVNYGGTNYTAAGWQGLGYEANSVIPLTVQNIVNFTNGRQTTTVGNDIALNVGIFEDNINVARPGGPGFDMGAFEIDNTLLTAPLPVIMTSSELLCEGGKVHIHWETASELQCDYYIVEKSTDGINWEKLVTVNGPGNSYEPMEYHAYDESIHREGMYYRIVQVDLNGTHTVFTPEFINCTELPCEDFNVRYTGNSELTIYILCDVQEVTYSLYNVSGQLISSSSSPTTAKEISLNLHLTSGVYIVQLTGNGKTYIKRIVI